MSVCPNCGQEKGDGAYCASCGASVGFAAQQSVNNMPDPFADFPTQLAAPDAPPYEPTYYAPDQTAAPPAKPKSMMPAYICGVVYPLILILDSLLFFVLFDMALWALLISFLLAATVGFFFIFGGFYFIIIPLPIVYLLKWGCVKPHQSTSRKVLTVLGIIAAIALQVVLMLVGMSAVL